MERVFGEGAENPLFNFTRSFQIREKAESGVLCHPATQGPLKSSLSGFSSEVSSQETKKEEKNKWAKNLILALCEDWQEDGHSRFVKDSGSLLVLPLCLSLDPCILRGLKKMIFLR